jgi:hypothetical protein
MAGVDHGLAGEDSSLRGEQYNALRSLAGGTRGDLQKHVGSVIAQVYARSFLTLSIAAIGGLILAIATSLQRGPLIPLMAIALGSLVAVASRIALLAYIDAVSFPTHFLYYCSPASPFLIIFVVLGIYLGLPSTHRNRV